VAITFVSPLGFHRVTFAISVCISYYSLFCHGIGLPIHLTCMLLVGLYCLFLSFCINFCSVLFSKGSRDPDHAPFKGIFHPWVNPAILNPFTKVEFNLHR